MRNEREKRNSHIGPVPVHPCYWALTDLNYITCVCCWSVWVCEYTRAQTGRSRNGTALCDTSSDVTVWVPNRVVYCCGLGHFYIDMFYFLHSQRSWRMTVWVAHHPWLCLTGRTSCNCLIIITSLDFVRTSELGKKNTSEWITRHVIKHTLWFHVNIVFGCTSCACVFTFIL